MPAVPVDDRSSRPRCWDRAGRIGVRADGSMGPVDGASQVVVIDGVVRSRLTAGALARAIRSGASVTSVAFDPTEVSVDTARTRVAAALAAGTLYSQPVQGLAAPMDLTDRLTEADVRAVAAFRRRPGTAGGLPASSLSDRQVHTYLTATGHGQRVVNATAHLADDALGHVLATAPNGEHAAAEILLAGHLGGAGPARTQVSALGAGEVLRSPIRAAASSRFPDLEPDQALAGLLMARTGDRLPTGFSHRDALRALAGVPADVDGNTWRERLSTLATEHPVRAARVLCVALHGEIDPDELEASFRSIAPPSLPDLMRLPPAALVAAFNHLDDGSIEPTDRLALAGRVASVFKKRTGDYLDLARRMGWTAHDTAASLSVPTDNRFAELVLSSRLTSWSSPKAARSAIRMVSAEWDSLVEHCDELPTTLSSALSAARSMSKLGPVWASTPFADVVGELNVGRSVARSSAAVWLLSQRSPSIYPHQARYRSGGYTGYFLDRADPRGLFLGELTDCCQHIGGEGEPCAVDGQMNPTSGFFVVERGGRVVAQSWVWLDENGQGVCFDNIERLDGALEGTAVGSFHTGVRQIYQDASDDLARRWAVPVTVGEGYSDEEFLDGLDSVEPLVPRDYDDYRDSRGQRILASPLTAELSEPRPVGNLAWEAVSGEIVTGTSSSHNGRGCVDFDSSQPGATELVEHLAAANPHQVFTLDGRVVGAPVELDYTPLVDDLGLGPVMEAPDLDPQYVTAYLTYREPFAQLGVTDDHEALELVRAGADPDSLELLQRDCRTWGLGTDRVAALLHAGVASSFTLRACLDLGAKNLDDAIALARRSPSPETLHRLARSTAAKMDPQVLDRGLRIATLLTNPFTPNDLENYTGAVDIPEHIAAAAIDAYIPVYQFREWDLDGVLTDELARDAGHRIEPFTGTVRLPRWARQAPGITERLDDAGIDPRMLNVYRRAGVHTFDQACRAVELGYDVRATYRCMRKTEDITPLLEVGATADQAVLFFDMGYDTADIEYLVSNKITPDDIQEELDRFPELSIDDLLLDARGY